MIRVTVSLDFTTRKKLSDDMVFSMSEQSAHSETWLKLPENRHSMVDTFEIVSISACHHQKGRIV